MPWNVTLICLAALSVFLLCGFQYHKMDITRIRIASEKITVPVKICILADLHCRRFGEKQSRITEAVLRENPDMILFPGDLFDMNRDYDISFELIRQLQGRWMAFSSGNHDTYLAEIDDLRRQLKEQGVRVLDNGSAMFNDEIQVIGIADRGRTLGFDKEGYESLKQPGYFHLLISHRPDFAEVYRELDYDLIVCGHNHGGQWRIPFTHTGIFGPHRTLFPKYTEGLHDLNGRQMFVGRGLASGDPHFFRLYNNPEIAFIELFPKEKDPS